MTHLTVSDRPVANFDVPWEEAFGYAQAVRAGDILYISGQVSHDAEGNLVAPAPLDPTGRPAEFSNMEEQMRTAYANAAALLRRFGGSLRDVVEETLYVLDVDAAFQVAGAVRKQAYGSARPRCASTLVGTTRLAFPELLVEISFTAVLRS